MNLLTVLAHTRPNYIDTLLETRSAVGAPAPLEQALLVLTNFVGDWESLGNQLGQRLPSPNELLQGLRRLPEGLRTAVGRADLPLVQEERWSAWTFDADGREEASRWVQFARGTGPYGALMPQDRDPRPHVAGFQGSPPGPDVTGFPGPTQPTPRLLLPLMLGISARPPYVTSVTETIAAGCEMDEDGECAHDESACPGSCGLVQIHGQSEATSLACWCRD